MIVGRNGLRANVETMGNWEKRAPLTRREEDRVKRKGRHEHDGATLKMDQQINEIEKRVIAAPLDHMLIIRFNTSAYYEASSNSPPPFPPL